MQWEILPKNSAQFLLLIKLMILYAYKVAYSTILAW
jgi:hypothetical protein